MADFLRKQAADRKGAASVLVIFMVMVLVTLGALAISSANANYKLSQRALDWNIMYYDLDAKGEEFLWALDGKLAEAEMTACEYMKNKGYQSPAQTDLPEQLQSAIFAAHQGNDLKDNEVFNKIYMYYADKYLEDLMVIYPELAVYASDDGTFINYILTEISLESELDELCSLNVSIWVEPIEYEIIAAGGDMPIARANDDLRYKIEDWYEYQQPMQSESEEVDIWDGSL